MTDGDWRVAATCVLPVHSTGGPGHVVSNTDGTIIELQWGDVRMIHNIRLPDVACAECLGEGEWENEMSRPVPCLTCDGTGKVAGELVDVIVERNRGTDRWRPALKTTDGLGHRMKQWRVGDEHRAAHVLGGTLEGDEPSGEKP